MTIFKYFTTPSFRIFLFLIFCASGTKNTYAYLSLNRGLYFYSHESLVENRTSLILNNKEPYELASNDIFSLQFDLHIRNNESIQFGDIFKIISNEAESYNFLLNHKKELFFVLDKQGKKEEFKKTNFGEDVDYLKVKIVFNKLLNQITLTINGKKIVYNTNLRDINSLLINFGKCNIEGFKSYDVPPIILHNVLVIKNNKTLNHWTFDKYLKNTIYDSIEQKEAWFNSGKMLIDNSVQWQKIGSTSIRTTPQIAFDSSSNQIIMLDSDRKISFSVRDGKFSYSPMENVPTDLLVNRLIYDYSSGRLLSYNFNPARLNYFDNQTNRWEGLPIDERHEFSQHNRYLSLKDSSLYLYGGYGHYRYKGDLFKVNLKTGEWVKKDLSSLITPRYLAAMGGNKTGDKIYLLGGKGAEMGLQELSPKNFFDLYEIDLNTLKPKLLYKNEEEQKKNLLFSNNLIVDDKNEFIYTLAYPTEKTHSYFQLIKIGINNPTIERYADSVKYFFKDDVSYCDLFFSASLSKLIAVIAYSKDRINSDVEIYTLDFPPLQASDLHTIPTKPSYWKLILGIVAVFIGLIIYKKVKSPKEKSLDDNISYQEINEEPFNEPNLTPQYYNRNGNSILFLGEFQVFDKHGKEITESFSPTLKYLLILLVLYTTKNGKGISSGKLEETLWLGKSEKSAINNRNVNISKLRLLLESFDNIDISNKNGNWSVNLPEDVVCDYVEILNLSAKIKDNTNYDIKHVEQLLELLSYGELLPNIQYEWIDSFKSNFNNLVIDTLLFIVRAESAVIRQDLSTLTLLKISDTIFIFDPISEDAIKVKCKALYDLGKKSLAKNAFENFSKRYSSLLGEDFKGSLKDMIE